MCFGGRSLNLFVNLVLQQWRAVFGADETKIWCDKWFLASRCLFRFLFTFGVRFETTLQPMGCFWSLALWLSGQEKHVKRESHKHTLQRHVGLWLVKR